MISKSFTSLGAATLLVFAGSLSFILPALGEPEWRGIDGGKLYSGPKLSTEALSGKVVMVDCWGVNCPPCRALLPRLEEYWKSMKGKPFVLIGSHMQGDCPDKIQALVDEHKLTYSIYNWCGLSEGVHGDGSLPFIYVVDPKLRVVYSGRRLDEAKAAVEVALQSVLGPDALCAVKLNKYKALKKKLTFGQNIEPVVKTLKSDLNGHDEAKAEEAKEILEGINESHDALKDTIEVSMKKRPTFTLTKMKLFVKTWPSEAEEYEGRIAKLSARADVQQCLKLMEEAEKCSAMISSGGATAVRGKKMAAAMNKKYASLAAGKSAICHEAATILKELCGE